MRVVAGSAGRLSLSAPRGLDVRPTMDKVRAACFDSLGGRVAGARVADLFAGSGAVGIEALSRGAARADFVESDRRALDCIRENLERAGLAASARVVERDVPRFLRAAAQAGECYDLVYADPPYAGRGGCADYLPLLLGAAGLRPLLAAGGLAMIECPASQRLPEAAGWRLLRDRKYGRSRVIQLAPDSGKVEA